MVLTTEYPYNEYNGYLIKNRENRRHICLVHKVTKLKKTISYARYLVSVNEKRILESFEHVDHIDNDKTNDSLSNLQILSQYENNKKYRESSNIFRKKINLKCPNCDIIYEKYKDYLYNKKFSVCSKKCLHNFLKVKRTSEELIEIGLKQIIK
jgi:superfamily II DNA helicase RecQ